MTTLTLGRREVEYADSAAAKSEPVQLGWILVLPLVFFAAHGAFSFQSIGYVAQRGMPGVIEARTRGFIGQFLMPGAIYSIVTLLIWSRLRGVLALAKQFKMLTVLALLAAFSPMWSQDPARSALFGIFYLLDTLFAYYLVARFDPEEIVALVMRAGAVVLVLSLILVLFFPTFGVMHGDARIEGAWQGIFIDRANAAKCFTFFLSPALVSKRPLTFRRFAYIAATATMLIETRAVTAVAVLCTFTVFVVLLRLSRRLDRKLLVLGFIACFAALLVMFVVGNEYGLDILNGLGRDATLSGRTGVWHAVTAAALKRPLLGYGYYAFWQTPSAELANVLHTTNWSFGYAHNGILEIALQLGLLGVVVFSSTLLCAFLDSWFCIRHNPSGQYDWLVGMILLTVLYNLDEETVAWPNELLSILYVIVCCSLARARTRLMHEEQHVYV